MEKILINKGELFFFKKIPVNMIKDCLFDISDEGLKYLIEKGYKLKKVFYYWEFE